MRPFVISANGSHYRSYHPNHHLTYTVPKQGYYRKTNYTRTKTTAYRPVRIMTQGRQLLRRLAPLLWLLTVPCALAGNTETEVKAAFIYNFTKFVEWPVGALPADAPMQLCVLGKDEVGNRLRQLHGREAQGRPLQVRYLSSIDERAGCHVLFIARDNEEQLGQLLKTLTDHTILTVSDARDFTRKGGMIELYVESSRVQFMVNLGPAQQSGLKISARMLQLARTSRRAAR